MAEVIDSFLVGVGYDYDNKGEKEIDSGIGSLKSKALQLATVVAGGFGIKNLTRDFAAAKDELGKFSNVFGVTANDVAAMGRALEHEGGSLETFMTQLSSLEKMRAGLLIGDVGFFESLSKAKIDPNIILQAENATDAYIALADVFEKLSGQERLNAAEALGFDKSAIRLLSNGSEQLEKIIQKEKEMRPITDEMTDSAAKFNDAWQDIGTNIGGVADKISNILLPATTDALDKINKKFDDFRAGGIQKAFNLTDEQTRKVTDFQEKVIDVRGSIADFIRGDSIGEADNRFFTNPDTLENFAPSLDMNRSSAPLITNNTSSHKTSTRETTQPLEIKNVIQIDGRVIDERVHRVTEQNNKRALDDLTTDVDG